jgi:hypothetical protein
MPEHLKKIITEFDVVPNKILDIFVCYLFYLILDAEKHELRTAAKHFSYHEASYSRLLSSPQALVTAKACLNRAARRRIDKLKTSKDIFLIIDATMIGRSGKKFQNRGKFHSGKKFVDGYKVTNFCLYVDGELIPLACLPHYSRRYCKELGYRYQSEPEMVAYWIEHLGESGLLPQELISKLHFLLDSAYDVKAIQSTIRSIGAHFTMSIKKDRKVNGQQVSEYFRTHRCIPYRTIRLPVGNSSSKTKKYRIRSAGKSHLKGYGVVCVVSSQKLQSRGTKNSRKFLITSRLNQSARKTVEAYATRWKIETWHRTMKQQFGYGDCRALKFSAVEAHLNLCLLAYQLSRAGLDGLPKPGTTLESYIRAEQWRQAVSGLSKFGGRLKIKSIAAAEVEALTTLKACA